MPLYRRIARRGFNNARFRSEISIVNLEDLEKKYEAGETVNAATLYERRLVRKKNSPVKVLGKGKLTKKLVVEAERISAAAREAVLGAGGEVRQAGTPAGKGKTEVARPEDEKRRPAGKKESKADKKEVNDEGNGE